MISRAGSIAKKEKQKSELPSSRKLREKPDGSIAGYSFCACAEQEKTQKLLHSAA